TPGRIRRSDLFSFCRGSQHQPTTRLSGTAAPAASHARRSVVTSHRPTISRRTALAALGSTAMLAGTTGLFQPSPARAAAPQLGPSGPTHFRFKLGDFEVTTILDGAVQLDGPHPIFGQNVAEEEVQALAEQNFLPPSRLEISFTPIVANTGTELVLFDTGNGAA